MREKIEEIIREIIRLAKLMERNECSAEWFDSGRSDNYREAGE